MINLAHYPFQFSLVSRVHAAPRRTLAAISHQAPPPSPSFSALLACPLLTPLPHPVSVRPSALIPCRTVPRAGSGLLGPARGPARLRSAPRARGAAAGVSPARSPRLAAPLLGPRVLARIPGPLSSTTAAVAACTVTPLHSRAAPPPGVYPARGPHLAAPSPHVRLAGPARIPGLPLVHRGCGRLRTATDHFASWTRRAWPALTAPTADLLAALSARGRQGRRYAVDARL